MVHEGLAQHGMAIFAHDQYAGKGQRGKTWTAEADQNIAISLILDPTPLNPTQQFSMSACIAVATLKFLSKYIPSDLSIKWPNDLYWQDRKAGGILVESVIRGNNWNRAVAGIGINVNQVQFPSMPQNPVSLKQITGNDFVPAQLARELGEIVLELVEQLKENGWEEVLKKYRENLYRRNLRTRFRAGSRTFEGEVVDVTHEGKLIVGDEQFEWGELEWLQEQQ